SAPDGSAGDVSAAPRPRDLAAGRNARAALAARGRGGDDLPRLRHTRPERHDLVPALEQGLPARPWRDRAAGAARVRRRRAVVGLNTPRTPRRLACRLRVTQLPPPGADTSRIRRLLVSRKVQILFNGGFGLALLAVAVVSARHFVHDGWPLHHADPWPLLGSGLLFLLAYLPKALGWQRLFHEHER